MNSTESAQAGLAKLKTTGIAALVVGAIGLAVGFFLNKDAALQSYLFAWIFWVGVTLGCLSLTLLHHMIRGNWAKPILRLAEAGGGPICLLVMGLLFIPIAVFLPQLYVWANHDALAANPGLRNAVVSKEAYLNFPFFVARTVMYFAIWIAFAAVLRRSSLAQDQTGDPRETDKRASIAAPGVVIYCLTVTFAFIDWVMSLDPRWSSTIYGLWFIISHGLGGLSLLTMIALSQKDREPYKDAITPVFTRDVGNVLLALTMFWGYFSLSQFLIIYSGNLPEEITYFMNRMHDVWEVLGTVIVLWSAVTFLSLLSGKTKRTPAILFRVALGIFALRILDHFWNIIPFFVADMKDASLAAYWVAVPAFLALGGVWLVTFSTMVVKAPLLPEHAARLAEREALEHA